MLHVGMGTYINIDFHDTQHIGQARRGLGSLQQVAYPPQIQCVRNGKCVQIQRPQRATEQSRTFACGREFLDLIESTYRSSLAARFERRILMTNYIRSIQEQLFSDIFETNGSEKMKKHIYTAV